MHELSQLLHIIDKQTHIILDLTRIIGRLTRSESEGKVRLVFTTNINNNQFIIMASLNLNANQFSIETLQLIDSDTGLPVQATFANVVFTSSDPNVFTTTPVPGSPNQTRDDAVAPGTATLNVTADVTYTDNKTNQPVTKNLTSNVPVTVAAVTAGENVALQIVVGTPQNK